MTIKVIKRVCTSAHAVTRFGILSSEKSAKQLQFEMQPLISKKSISQILLLYESSLLRNLVIS